MKKNRPIPNTLLQIMKITLMQLGLAFAFSGFAFAHHSYAQPELNQKVTINVENKQLKKVLSQIESITKVSFTYVPQVIQAERKVNLSVNNELLGDVLQKLFSPLNISFEIIGKKIVLSKAKGSSTLEPINDKIKIYSAATISGKVTDKNDGTGLPGVNIGVKGTTVGTTTGLDGTYTLTNVPDNAVLTFSFIGYVSQEIVVGSQSVINIVLVPDIKVLEEVVVIGYGTQQKKDATGGVVNITSKDFNQGIIASPEQLLQGRAAGIQITPSSGDPGSAQTIRIRGTSSLRGNNTPLYVVDGVPLSNDAPSDGAQNLGAGTSDARNPLNFINPQDIESISVLKDASSAAIYGSRGANGVVLITTKKGKSGQQTVNFSASTGVSKPRKLYNLLNATDFIKATTAAGNPNPNDPTINAGSNTDWQKEIYRTAVQQNYNLSFGGGNDNTRYLFSASYNDIQGITKTTGLTRVTGRINASHELFNDKVKIDLQLTNSRTNNKYSLVTNNAGAQGSLLGATYQTNPTFPVYDANGRYFTPNGYGSNGLPNSGDFRNPVAMLNGYHDTGIENTTLASISGTWFIIDGLSYKINLGLNSTTAERKTGIDPGIPGFAASTFNNISSGNGAALFQNRTTSNTLIEHTLNYSEKVGIGRLDAIIGYSYQKFSNLGHYSQSGNFLDLTTQNRTVPIVDNIGAVNNRDYKSFFISQSGNEYDLQSFFGRLNYNISDKYLLTATVRSDGSSKFGANNKYGTFPSLAAAWRLSNEAFMQKGFFDDLKLRINWGITGSQDGLPANGTLPTFVPDANNAVFVPTTLANPNLKWEQTRQFGVGIDFVILNNRLSGTVDYFDKATSNQLFYNYYPSSIAAPYLWINLPKGKFLNKGIEVSLNYQALTNGKFKWDINYNMTYLKTKLTDFGATTYNTGQIDGQGLSGAYSQRLADGYAAYTFYLPVFTGYNDKGIATYSDNQNPAYLGSALPKYIFGLNNSFIYGNWSLNIFFNAQTGFFVYNNTANALFTKAAVKSGRNVIQDAANSAESGTNSAVQSSRFLEKGNFIRLSNLSLGYNFKLPQTSSIKNLRVSATGQNLFLITKYSGLDPEINTNKSINGVPSAGIDYTNIPNPRTVTIGLSAGF